MKNFLKIFKDKKKKSDRRLTYEALLPYAEENLEKINVVAGRYDGSQKCHHISRQILEDGQAEKVVVTLSFLAKSGVNVHFINKIKGEYVDHTLGYLSKNNTYYLVSEHNQEELQGVNMLKMLTKIKQDFIDNFFTKKEQRKLKISTSSL